MQCSSFVKTLPPTGQLTESTPSSSNQFLKSTDQSQIAKKKRGKKTSARFDGKPPESWLDLDCGSTTLLQKVGLTPLVQSCQNFDEQKPLLFFHSSNLLGVKFILYHNNPQRKYSVHIKQHFMHVHFEHKGQRLGSYKLFWFHWVQRAGGLLCRCWRPQTPI